MGNAPCMLPTDLPRILPGVFMTVFMRGAVRSWPGVCFSGFAARVAAGVTAVLQAPTHILAAGEGPDPWAGRPVGFPALAPQREAPAGVGEAPPPAGSLWGRLPSSVLTASGAPAVICFLLRVSESVSDLCLQRPGLVAGSAHEPLCGVLVFGSVSEHPPFGAGRYPRQAHPGPLPPGLESTISPGSLVSLEWLRNQGVGPVSQHREPCGSWPLCAALPLGCCPVPEGPGAGRPQPSLSGGSLVWPLGLLICSRLGQQRLPRMP